MNRTIWMACTTVVLTTVTTSAFAADEPSDEDAKAADQTRETKEKLSPPQPFKSPDGKHNGWKVAIPGKRPLATPAIADGKLFLGGGFGSHEFYAFELKTGKVVWQYATADDGPTAAVVADGYVVFNTESCELEVLTLTGKPVWKKWLGDPLMSMPAVADGRIYMAYPDSKGDEAHKLACFDLKSGEEFWIKTIPGEIITAPVIKDQRVYLATLEGTLSAFDVGNGDLLWSDAKNATSSPVVWKDRCFFSRRTESTVTEGKSKVKRQSEQFSCRGFAKSDQTRDLVATVRQADYLDYSKRARSGKEAAQQEADGKVGFGGGFKGGGKIGQATANLGQASVSGVWSYQGSKPFMYRDKLYASMADKVVCVDPVTERVHWENKLIGSANSAKQDLLDAKLSPPALVNGKMFLGAADGRLYCLSVDSGEVLWKVDLKEPISFQPVVADGRVVVCTENGGLICIETGDPDDDGWLMWGANAAHSGNGVPKKE